MSVTYNGLHSITFIESDQDLSPGETLTSFISAKNTWIDLHLIPSSRPFVETPEAVIQMYNDTVSSKVFDITDSVAGGQRFGQMKGGWKFYIDHDKWPNWSTAKNEIEDYINGKKLYCFLTDDRTKLYHGRFILSSWDDGSNYSSITIEYDFDYGDDYNISDDLYTIVTAVLPVSMSAALSSGYPTIWGRQDKNVVKPYINATMLFNDGHVESVPFIDDINGKFDNSTGNQNVEITYHYQLPNTDLSMLISTVITIYVFKDSIHHFTPVIIDEDYIFYVSEDIDDVRDHINLYVTYYSGFESIVPGSKAEYIDKKFTSEGNTSVKIVYSGNHGYITINVQSIDNLWNAVKTAIMNGSYKNKYHIGDEIPIKDNYKAILIGIDKDVDQNNNQLAMTFMLNTQYAWNRMNTTHTNAGGYPATYVATTLMNEFYNWLPSILKNNDSTSIIAAKKTSTGQNTSNYIREYDFTNYFLTWILSVREIYGEDLYAQSATGNIYNDSIFSYEMSGCVYDEYFNSTERRKTYSGFLRSCAMYANKDSTGFHEPGLHEYHSGNLGAFVVLFDNGTPSLYGADYPNEIRPCFCVGYST